MECTGPRGPGATSGEALRHSRRHSHSPAEALADGRGGLGPYASSHGQVPGQLLPKAKTYPLQYSCPLSYNLNPNQTLYPKVFGKGLGKLGEI